MDKYTYNVKVDKIQKLVKRGEYAAAAQIADGIDWDEVHSVRVLTITAAAYEHIRDYKSAIELLQMAYEESAVGKRILYKLTGLAIADGNLELAQRYYEKYLQEAPDENGRYLLRYLLAELKGEPLDKRIAILETYRKYEFEEEWALRLAELYDEAGMADECVKLCDEIILWFGVGTYVEEAMRIKEKYAPLSTEQQEKLDNKEFYQQRYQNVVQEYTSREEALAAAEAPASEDDDEDEEDEELASEPLRPESEAPEAPAEPQEEPEDWSWTEQFCLAEASSMEEAVQKALDMLSDYHKAHGTPMAKLTKIAAPRLNALGLEAAKPHIAGKDLLVVGASQLAESVLTDMMRFVKNDHGETVFVLADAPTELAYLDAQMGNYLKPKAVELPEIAVTAPEEEVVIRVDDVMDAGSAEEEAPAAENAPAEAPAEESPAAAPAAEAQEPAAEVPAAQASGQTAPEEEAPAAQTSGQTAPEDTAAETEYRLPEDDDAYEQGTIEEFFRAQAAAEVAKFMAEEEKEAQEAKAAEEALAAEAPKAEPAPAQAAAPAAEVKPQAPTLPDNTAALAAEIVKAAKTEGAKEPEGSEEAAEDEFIRHLEAQMNVLHETERLPENLLEQVRAADSPEEQIQQAESLVDAEKTQVLPSVAEARKAALEKTGEVKAKPKTAPGSMNLDDFVQYAMNYIASIDCVTDVDGEDALYDAAEDRLDAGKALTKEEAENMIEAAADLAEKKGGLFARRYDKSGNLILKAKYIH